MFLSRSIFLDDDILPLLSISLFCLRSYLRRLGSRYTVGRAAEQANGKYKSDLSYSSVRCHLGESVLGITGNRKSLKNIKFEGEICIKSTLSETVFLNFYGALGSIPISKASISPDYVAWTGPVRQPYSYSAPNNCMF